MSDLSKTPMALRASETSGTSPPPSTEYARQKAKAVAAGTVAQFLAIRNENTTRHHAKRRAERDAQWLIDHPGFTLADRSLAKKIKKRNANRKRFPHSHIMPGRLTACPALDFDNFDDGSL
jgi:hypothetical protein